MVAAPLSEAALLERWGCRGRRVIDMRHFQAVRVESRGGRKWVVAGGGCQIKRLLEKWKPGGGHCERGPRDGANRCGATSTATYWSGRPSMSDFIAEMRIATYDAVTGEPVNRVISEAIDLWLRGVPVLWASSCQSASGPGRGRTSKALPTYDQLEGVRAKKKRSHYNTFFSIPWLWRYSPNIAANRRAAAAGGVLPAVSLRNFDIGRHLLVRWHPTIPLPAVNARFVSQCGPADGDRNW